MSTIIYQADPDYYQQKFPKTKIILPNKHVGIASCPAHPDHNHFFFPYKKRYIIEIYVLIQT